MKVINSRQRNFDRQKCVANVGGNQYELVLYAAAHARDLDDQRKKDKSKEISNLAMDALFDIQDKTVGR